MDGGVITIRMHEYFFWSPTLGTDAVRFSVPDAHGREYYSIRPIHGAGKSLRELREHVALRIHDAIESGTEPGEVM